MAAFGGLIITNKGRALQAKAQVGTELKYTRIKVGDGNLGGQSIPTLTDLISPKMDLGIAKLEVRPGGKAVLGTVLNNSELTTGFYFREIGVFATDPDEGEILYCYGNAGPNAEYIPPGGGPDIIEKYIDVITIVGNSPNVSAVIDESLIFVTSVNGRTGAVTIDKTDVGLGNVDNVQQATKTDLDNLIERIGNNSELNTVEKTKIILALNEVNTKATNTQQALTSHLAETSHKHIHESGASANGRYIRFDDGTQICWQDINVAVLGVNSGTWTYPASFVENPNVIAILAAVNTTAAFDEAENKVKQGVVPIRKSGRSVTSCDYYYLTATSSSQTIELLAFGRWK